MADQQKKYHVITHSILFIWFLGYWWLPSGDLANFTILTENVTFLCKIIIYILQYLKLLVVQYKKNIIHKMKDTMLMVCFSNTVLGLTFKNNCNMIFVLNFKIFTIIVQLRSQKMNCLFLVRIAFL